MFIARRVIYFPRSVGAQQNIPFLTERELRWASTGYKHVASNEARSEVDEKRC